MKRLNWRKAGLAGKRTLSTVDEGEYRQRDAAARWVERHGKAKGKGNRHGRRSGKGVSA